MAFAALPGFYSLLFVTIEPVSTFTPALMAWVYPGVEWFHHQMVPSVEGAAIAPLGEREKMVAMQLANCYLLLGLMSSLVFRAVRDALPNNAEAQERIVAAILTALALADVTHIAVTLYTMPQSIALQPSSWNTMTHGNVTVVIFLFLARMAWFAGIGRKANHITHVKRA